MSPHVKRRSLLRRLRPGSMDADALDVSRVARPKYSLLTRLTRDLFSFARFSPADSRGLIAMLALVPLLPALHGAASSDPCKVRARQSSAT